MTMERPDATESDFALTPPDPKDDSVQSGLSRYEVDQLLWSNQELDVRNDALEQKLERLTSRLQEIENSAKNYLATQTGDNQRQTYATRLVVAQELLKELKS